MRYLVRWIGLSSLAIFAAGLGVLNWLLWTAPELETDNVHGGSATAWQPDLSPSSGLEFRPMAISEFKQSLEHPVFSLTRKPPEPRPPPSPPVVPKNVPPPSPPIPTQPTVGAEQFHLNGVAIAGNERQALIRSPSNQLGKWQLEGAEIDGWKLVQIEAETATIEFGGTRSELRLYGANDPPPAK